MSIYSVIASVRTNANYVVKLGTDITSGYNQQSQAVLAQANAESQAGTLTPEKAQAYYGAVSQYQSTATAIGNNVLTQQTGFISKDIEAIGTSNRLLA